MSIIKSMLDTDQYKITVMRVFFKHFTNMEATYVFKCRNSGIVFTQEQVDRITAEIADLCTLRFTEEELQWLKNLYYMQDANWFIEFLRMFKLNRDHIKIWLNEDKQLEIEATGPIWQVMYFETFVMSIVNEVYFIGANDRGGMEILENTIGLATSSLHPLKIADFGTRRRFSRVWQKTVIEHLVKASGAGNFTFVGTSNMDLARKMGLTAIGTFGHEFVQACQALPTVPIALSQQKAFEIWQTEFDGALGHALHDTLGNDKFFRDFGRTWCKLFDGVRHDSGEPIEFGEMMIEHYKKYNVNPLDKTIVFSDGLDICLARKINTHFANRIGVSFGIGTKLTNNFEGYFKPLNIVFKMIQCGGKPVAKLSNDDSKIMCRDMEYVKYLRNAISGKFD